MITTARQAEEIRFGIDLARKDPTYVFMPTYTGAIQPPLWLVVYYIVIRRTSGRRDQPHVA